MHGETMQIITDIPPKHYEALAEMGLRPNYTVVKACQRSKPKNLHAWYQGVYNFWKTQGPFTDRQFYYAVISGRIPNCSLDVSTTAKANAGYAKVIDVCTNARLWGIIPFDAVLDDSSLYGTKQQEIPVSEFLKHYAKNYRSNWWEDQENYVEVWCEKRALSRIIYQTTEPLGVYLCVGGKYPSWSQLWNFKERFENSPCSNGYILYFGDFDPTGVDMDRFIEDTLSDLDLFSVNVERVAISIGDAQKLQNVGVKLKARDTRTAKFLKLHETVGITKGVELDALTPKQLQANVMTAISSKIDLKALEEKIQEDKNAIEKAKQYLDKFQP